MKISKLWLQELVNLPPTTEELARQLTMAGLEIDNISPVATEFSGVVVGEILTVAPHPNADKLSICTVTIGNPSNILEIVCGATNVRPQLKVPVALIGARLPGNIVIKKAKLRGIESNGMLCAAQELGLAANNTGIHELPQDAPLGENLRQYLSLDDEILEIELTTDRGDCLSVLGIAREISALNHAPINYPIACQKTCETTKEQLTLNVIATNTCPHYSGRIIRDVNNRAATPYWMAERLRRMGMEPINLLVDITNYVMLELGQPLHGFSLDKIQGGITVRYAKDGEQLDLINGQQINLNTSHMVIADDDKCLALAGVMGGNASKITQDTRDIFLESAFFIPEKIACQSSDFNLLTDAAHRYTHGVDYKLPQQALERATALILELAGGIPSATSEFIAPQPLLTQYEIFLPRNALPEIVGIILPDEQIEEILKSLGIKLKAVSSGWQAQIPSWRYFDLKIKEDLVAEIARIYGYQHIPEQKMVVTMDRTNIRSEYNDLERIRYLLEDRGYYEAVTYSFIDDKTQELVGESANALNLVNPLSSDQSTMRTSLWPGLLKVLHHNLRRQVARARLFEIGLCFKQDLTKGLEQPLMLAGINYGELYPKQWSIKQNTSNDFYDLKNDLYAILKLFVPTNDIQLLKTKHRALHPGRGAQVLVCGEPIGYFGELHPELKMHYVLERNASIFEVDLSFINNKLRKKFKEYSVFPCVNRDIALVMDRDITWQQIKEKIVEVTGKILHNASVFDIYQSKGLGDNKQSMAIRLTFQSVSRTLKEDEVTELLERLLKVLEETFGINLRK